MVGKRGKQELERLNAYPEALEVDPCSGERGVLLGDQIKFYAEQYKLIDPFDESNLKPAAYELTVGDEYYVGGEYRKLDDDGQIELPPFEVSVIKTAETLHLPRFLIARWNIRVKWAYEGLLWVGGPQVDPGYLGHLFCPIYNLSDQSVFIKRGDHIAVIDFVKTTKFDTNIDTKNNKWHKYPKLPKRPTIQDFGVEDFQSALFTQAGQRLSEMNEEIKEMNRRFMTFTNITFVTLAIIVSAITLLFMAGSEREELARVPAWTALILSISALAVILSIFNFFSSARWARGFGPKMGLFIGLVTLAGILGLGVYHCVTPPLPDGRQMEAAEEGPSQQSQNAPTGIPESGN